MRAYAPRDMRHGGAPLYCHAGRYAVADAAERAMLLVARAFLRLAIFRRRRRWLITC